MSLESSGTSTDASGSKNIQKQTDLVCNICCATFHHKDALSNHIRRAHFGLPDNKADAVVPVFIDDSGGDDDVSDTAKSCHASDNDESYVNVNNDTSDIDRNHDVTVSDKDESDMDESYMTSQSVCDICNSIFKDNNDLAMHKKLSHPSSSSNSGDCECRESINDDHFYENLVEQDKISDIVVIAEPVSNNCTQIKKSEEVYNNIDRVICNICIEEFVNKAALTIHIKSVHFGISNYKCAMCDESFTDKSQVIKHYNVCTASGNQDKDGTIKKSKKNSLNQFKSSQSFKSRLRSNKTIVKTCRRRLNPRKKIDLDDAVRDNGGSREESDNIPTSKLPRARLRPRKAIDWDDCDESPAVTVNEEDSRIKTISNVNMISKKKKSKATLPRPCFICRTEILKSEGYSGHLHNHHHFDPFDANNIDKDPGFEFTFKCLRCGKVGTLYSIQIHLQSPQNNQSCIRVPFDGTALLDQLYCTICGKTFGDVSSHDEHVASEHYSNVYKSDTNLACIPFPHILSYSVATDVCKHCTKMCHFTLQSCVAAERANRPFVACLVSPFVCPYDHISKHSRCTLELLLYHTKFCEKKAGTLALQCNNCFKMLLCNNTSQQIGQLKEVVNMESLECCEDTAKTFKCYCCGKDFRWSEITEKLKKSIEILSIISNPLTLDETKRMILQRHPTVHIKGYRVDSKQSVREQGLQAVRQSAQAPPVRQVPRFVDVTNFKYSKSKVNTIISKRRKSAVNVVTAGKSIATNRKTSTLAELSNSVNPATMTQLTQMAKVTQGYTQSQPEQIRPNMFKRMQRNYAISTHMVLSQSTELKAPEMEKVQGEKSELAHHNRPTKIDHMFVSSTIPKKIQCEWNPVFEETRVAFTQPQVKAAFVETVQDEKSDPAAFTAVTDAYKSTAVKSIELLQVLKQQSAELRAAQEIETEIELPVTEIETEIELPVTEIELPVTDVKAADVKADIPLLVENDTPLLVANDVPLQKSKPDAPVQKMADLESQDTKSSVDELQLATTQLKDLVTVIENFQPNLTTKNQPVAVVKPEPANLPCLTKPEVSADNEEHFNRVLVCPICSKTNRHSGSVYSDPQSFVLHMMRHEAKRAKHHRCWDCDAAFKRRPAWKEHVLVSHPTCILLKCGAGNCEEEFQRPQDLQNHIKYEHVDSGFGCTVCLRYYSDEATLMKHMQVHSVGCRSSP